MRDTPVVKVGYTNFPEGRLCVTPHTKRFEIQLSYPGGNETIHFSERSGPGDYPVVKVWKPGLVDESPEKLLQLLRRPEAFERRNKRLLQMVQDGLACYDAGDFYQPIWEKKRRFSGPGQLAVFTHTSSGVRRVGGKVHFADISLEVCDCQGPQSVAGVPFYLGSDAGVGLSEVYKTIEGAIASFDPLRLENNGNNGCLTFALSKHLKRTLGALPSTPF